MLPTGAKSAGDRKRSFIFCRMRRDGGAGVYMQVQIGRIITIAILHYYSVTKEDKFADHKIQNVLSF